MNHLKLFRKLVGGTRKGTLGYLAKLLVYLGITQDFFSKTGSVVSLSFKESSVVRQDEILSPCLYSVCTVDLSVVLRDIGTDCHITD